MRLPVLRQTNSLQHSRVGTVPKLFGRAKLCSACLEVLEQHLGLYQLAPIVWESHTASLPEAMQVSL